MVKATSKQERDARTLVRLRDGHRCQMCGRSIVDYPSSIHHRINRGMGGNARLERASLLIRICGGGTTDCHGWVTGNPALAGDVGWLLPKNNPDIDPTREPILTINDWVLLDDEGNWARADMRMWSS